MKMNYTDGIIFLIVFSLIALDFVSGIVAAFATNSWKSSVMRKGLLHKCSLLLCIALGVILNFGQAYLEIGVSIPCYQSISAYVALMESGSILENLCKANPELMGGKLRSVFGLPAESEKKEENKND